VRRVCVCLVAALAVSIGRPASGQEKPAGEAPKKIEKPDKAEPPKPEKFVTQHTAVIGAVTVNYTATAGTLIVRNEKDEPWASIGYVAYVKPGADASARAEARRHGRRRADAASALPARRERIQHPRQVRPRHDRPGRDRNLARRR
jgi:hypothetical protein